MPYPKVTEHPVRAIQSGRWQVSRLADIGPILTDGPALCPPSRPRSQWHEQTFPVTVAGAAAFRKSDQEGLKTCRIPFSPVLGQEPALVWLQ